MLRLIFLTARDHPIQATCIPGSVQATSIAQGVRPCETRYVADLFWGKYSWGELRLIKSTPAESVPHYTQYPTATHILFLFPTPLLRNPYQQSLPHPSSQPCPAKPTLPQPSSPKVPPTAPAAPNSQAQQHNISAAHATRKSSSKKVIRYVVRTVGIECCIRRGRRGM